jgi:hypothetical protein
VADVGGRVVDLRGGQRPCGPVVALARRRQRDAQPGLEQRVEAERLAAEEARGDGRVEDGVEGEAEAALEMGQVVVGGVQDQQRTRLGEDRRQRRQIGDGERVDQPDTAVGAGQLQQGQALRIVMEAVALGVERDFRLRGERLRGARERRGVSDPDGVDQRARLVTARSSRSARRRSGSSASSCVIT